MQLPERNSRVAIIGKTGSGKSHFATALLRCYPNVVVLDPKNEFDWGLKDSRYERVAKTFGKLEQLLKKSQADGFPIIYRPDLMKTATDDMRLDDVYELAFRRTNTLVYADELYSVTQGGHNLSNCPGFFKVMTQGRSRGVGAFHSMQRPSHIPLAAISESHYRFIFNLTLATDRKKVEESFGTIPWEALAKNPHSFVMSTDTTISNLLRI